MTAGSRPSATDPAITSDQPPLAISRKATQKRFTKNSKKRNYDLPYCKKNETLSYPPAPVAGSRRLRPGRRHWKILWQICRRQPLHRRIREPQNVPAPVQRQLGHHSRGFEADRQQIAEPAHPEHLD